MAVIPQVGTLDSLVGLSDQLAKLDPFMESLVRHVAQYISDILGPEDAQRLQDNLLVGSSKGMYYCVMVNFYSAINISWGHLLFQLFARLQ